MKKIPFFLLLLIMILLASCKKDDKEPIPSDDPWYGLKTMVVDVMEEQYLWNHMLPSVDIAWYENPSDLLEALMYKPLDRWSYIQEASTYQQFFEEGQYLGFGFGMKWADDGTLRVSFVYKDSPAERAGMSRSAKIVSINNKSVFSLLTRGTLNQEFGPDTEGHTISMQIVPAGEEETIQISMSKELVTLNTVLHKDIINLPDKRVAYLVLNNFIEPSLAELEEAFQYFIAGEANELILDMRYNGGGRLHVAQLLCSYINTTKTSGQVFIEFQYNPSRESQNQKYGFVPTDMSLNVPRLVVIATRSTASASEVIINSLYPFIPVKIIGDRTYGKPVGSVPANYQNQYVIVPVSVRIANAEGNANYFSGFPVDGPAEDGLAFDLGDTEEPSLAEALYYIRHGSFSSKAIKRDTPSRPVETSGWRFEVGAW